MQRRTEAGHVGRLRHTPELEGPSRPQAAQPFGRGTAPAAGRFAHVPGPHYFSTNRRTFAFFPLIRVLRIAFSTRSTTGSGNSTNEYSSPTSIAPTCSRGMPDVA